MLKISNESKKTDLLLTISNEVVKLVITSFTIEDACRRNRLVSTIIEDVNISDVEKYNAVQFARIMCSVKKPNGEYYWDGSIDEFKKHNFEFEFINLLAQAVTELNPVQSSTVGNSLESKKN